MRILSMKHGLASALSADLAYGNYFAFLHRGGRMRGKVRRGWSW